MSSNENHPGELDVETLGSVTGGKVKPNAYAPVGSRARCAFVKNEIENRADLIVDHATRGTIGGMREGYATPIFSNGVVRSQLMYEQRLRCHRK